MSYKAVVSKMFDVIAAVVIFINISFKYKKLTCMGFFPPDAVFVEDQELGSSIQSEKWIISSHQFERYEKVIFCMLTINIIVLLPDIV